MSILDNEGHDPNGLGNRYSNDTMRAADRYWEGRWRDEKAENEQLRRDMCLMAGKQVIEIERLREVIRQRTKLLDDQLGTPCQQIRHEQDVDNLKALLSGSDNLRAILADQPFQNSVLTVYEIATIINNEGGFAPNEAMLWFREWRERPSVSVP